MALFKKSHSRSKPVIEGASASSGSTYINNEKFHTINLCAPGGPPYSYWELQLSESEMLGLAAAWFTQITSDRARDLRKHEVM